MLIAVVHGAEDREVLAFFLLTLPLVPSCFAVRTYHFYNQKETSLNVQSDSQKSKT